ncbi:hypothetical protein DRE_00199 [Drechslerella stenobrocha 248]|uniref:Tryptophan synthase beta chain-like PALP domain-containing protein n=1 Tax=Drechslerella stenobrocha 248 TaxID=1043628 RepID=W7HZF6_9PEZI|nr:hypothetical protein DRE_00199 [Drechslerella stenobrocha 248]
MSVIAATPVSDLPLTRASVQAAHERIKPHIHLTPSLTSRTLDRFASTPRSTESEGIKNARSVRVVDAAAPVVRMLFKCENLQRGGAFKIRGATHAHPPSQPPPVVMPRISTPSKIAATQSYGATVVFSGSTAPEREAAVCAEQARTGATLVPPYDHPFILLGQGTVALELIDQAREAGRPLDAIIAPCGGGGLLSGIATACRGTGVRVFGAEPRKDGANDCQRGLRRGKRVEEVRTLTIADGLRTPTGATTYAIIEEAVDGVFSVTEWEILMAREGGEKGWNVGVVFSGGNTTVEVLAGLFAREGEFMGEQEELMKERE